MRIKFFFAAVLIAVILSSCGMQKFYIGETSGQTFNQDKRKCMHLFWGIVPIGRKQSFPSYADAKGYEITTRFSLVDYVISGLTGGIVTSKTVKFEPKK